MAHDQYQIPGGYNASDIRAELESIQFTPEREAAPYQRIKDIEDKIFSYRATAMAVVNKPSGWLHGLTMRPQQKSVSELIDEESRYGGKMFGEGHRFWLDNKGGDTVFQNDVADWYHLQVNPANPKRPTVLRFQTTPHSIHKLYEGREYAPTLQDLEIFVKAVEGYAQAILPLYPIDQALDELLTV